MPSTATICRRPTVAMRWGRSGATKSRGRGGSGSSINAMPIRSARRRWRRMPRSARCWPIRWRRWAFARGDYIMRVNNRKVLNGVMEVAGILDPADPEKFAHERGIVLRAIDKLDRLGPDGVRALLGEGRKDESGDFTKGAGLAEAQAEVVMGFMAAKRDTGAGHGGAVARTGQRVADGRRGRARAGDDRAIADGAGLRPGPDRDRPLGRARPRLLHRPGVRGRTDLRDHRRKGPPAPVRQRGGRRAL